MIGLLLAGSLCILPFQMPYHELPAKTFHAEWLAAALGISAALAALAGRVGPVVSWPSPARWLIAFALFLACQAAYGDPVYPQLPLLAALYALYAALMIWLGAQLASALGIERVAVTLAGFLLAGALLTALLGLIQFYGRPKLLEDLILELHGKRAYGNIAQVNLYANYLAVGESALLYLWLRGRLPTVYALGALTLLVLGCALAGSRSTLLYVAWFALLAYLAGPRGAASRRFRLLVYALAGATLAASVAVPWLNAFFHLGPPDAGWIERTLDAPAPEPRPLLWLTALRVFAGAPFTGVGIGEFAGAAFDLGLHPSIVKGADIWTSAHNLPLDLLAETGAVGTVLALGGAGVWGWRMVRRLRDEAHPAVWWIAAAVSVELIHCLIEFPPLWYTPYLGVTALLMGVAVTAGPPLPAMSRIGRSAATAACAALAFATIVMLRDYLRLNETYVTGTTVTLARPADTQRDAAIMRDLSRGLMAPLAELWTVMGASLDRNDLAAKRAMSARAARYWPTYPILARHAVFLAFEGNTQDAQRLIEKSLATFPHRRDAIIAILEQAKAADSDAIEPLLRAGVNASKAASG